MKKDTYVNIQSFMVSELGLKGNELIVYAVIYGFCQDEDSDYHGSLSYLCDWTNSTKQGVMKALKSLIEKELLEKIEVYENGIKYCRYRLGGKQSLMVVNKVERGGKQSLMGYETKFNGGGKQSLPNNIYNNKDIIKERDKTPSDQTEILKSYFDNCKILYDQKKINTEKPVLVYGQIGKRIKDLLQDISKEDIIRCLRNAMNDNWIIQKGYALNIILSDSQINRFLNMKTENENQTETNGIIGVMQTEEDREAIQRIIDSNKKNKNDWDIFGVEYE